MSREASSCDLKELVAKFIPEAIGKDIEKACQGIYPLQVRILDRARAGNIPCADHVVVVKLGPGQVWLGPVPRH